LPILRDVATALAAIDGDIVHRDLKPGNILLLNGKWCLADFGIAKYADATIAPDTRKDRLSQPYAAPEQWQLRTATSAADVYAFGIIAYELIAGQRPFLGPNFDQQHLLESPPRLTTGTPHLRSLIQQCLMKAPGARPSAAKILERLERATENAPATPGLQKLASANEQAVTKQAEKLREASAAENRERERAQLHESAVALFEPIVGEIIDALEAHAGLATVSLGAQEKLFIAALEGARIGLDRPEPSPQTRPFAGPFTVISESVITVTMERMIQNYRGRSHSLWFCDAEEENQFAWYEVAFMEWGGQVSRPPIEPYALSAWEVPPVAFGNVMGTMRIDWLDEIDLGDLNDFVGRWLGWFAEAAAETLRRPQVAENPERRRSWRE
jgi:eukaryotic-like serine/threonine-protein kinase